MILGPNEYLSNQKVENEHSAHGHLFYNLYKSDSYRYLGKSYVNIRANNSLKFFV